jgi:hypothetical protein
MSIAAVAVLAVGFIVVMLTLSLGRAAARGDADLEWRRSKGAERERTTIEARALPRSETGEAGTRSRPSRH